MTRARAWLRRRRAVIAVVALVVTIGGANMLWTARAVSNSNHAWCAVVTAITARPVPKPASPAANPSRATSYEWYLRFVRLGRDLGC